MTDNFKCKNLSETSIEINIDSMRYKMLPKGRVHDDGTLGDWCLMRPEHVQHPKVQAYLLCDPPKIEAIPLKNQMSGADVKVIVDKALEESTQQLGVFRNELSKLINESKKRVEALLASYEEHLNALIEQNKNQAAESLDLITDVKNKLKEIKVPTLETKTNQKSGKKSGASPFNR